MKGSSDGFTKGEAQQGGSEGEKEEEEVLPLATIKEVFSFGSGRRKTLCIFFGFCFACTTGAVFPALAFAFARVFEELGGSATSEEFLENIRTMAFVFMGLGFWTLISMTAQSALFETAALEMTNSLKTKWFDALLRQDLAYYDLKDVSGTATIISTNGAKYKKGVGRKLGESVQYSITFFGGFAYAFWASWRASLVILCVVPVMVLCTGFLVKINTTQTKTATENYAEAGSTVYQTVSSIRTVLSLNACQIMIDRFKHATEKAYKSAARFMPIFGLANGSMMGSFLCSYILLTLYGAYLLYDAVRESGCDPSGTVDTNNTCNPSAGDVFGALMGISFGAAVLPQVSASIEAFNGARTACYPALVAMDRRSEESSSEGDVETPMRRESVALPKYVIDSSSPEGKKPTEVHGELQFRNVSFAYPTRPETIIFQGLSLDVKAGSTVAIVGPSGGGKSTIAQLVERFYDPLVGSITLDGVDLRELNVTWLRDQIGLVEQEPKLFARSIRDNIAAGKTSLTQEEIESCAKMANAHDFIMSFPDGYDTQVGDKGTQISGGQRQRIAIARVLAKNSKILFMDEATSALDSESEKIVQAALDKLLEASNRTTLVIAHRLSTIRNADVIAVVDDGKIVETGNHEELMSREGHYYDLVQAQSTKKDDPASRHESIIEPVEKDITDHGNLPLLRFRDVHFEYPTRPEVHVFRGLELKVYQGETLAIVGPSGGGKSTTIQLIERFYDPSSGSVELQGVDLRLLNVKYLRDQLGLVGQEPVLYNTSIAENIKYGYPEATQEEIEDAARLANAHDFISSFPDKYDTLVGERGTQVSGGQKQRIALCRAIIKRPKILLLDEATSALDSESERVVQEALDHLMQSKEQTTIVIAHRLSTIRNADRIVVINNGRARETGTHDELMAMPNGLYKRLHMLQDLENEQNVDSVKTDPNASLMSVKKSKKKEDSKDEVDDESEEDKEAEKAHAKKARLMAQGDYPLFFVGGIGALLTGLVFPGWGIIFAYMIELLYEPVAPGLSQSDREIIADDMREMSFKITYGWLGVIGCTMIGNVLLYYGFGTASERMNKRVRDAAFEALVRQEVAYFDIHSVGTITSQLEDDAALIHSFSGEPIRTLVMNLSSVLVGLVVSFYYMWPFAGLTLFTIPFMAFGAEMEMKMYIGEDEAVEKTEDVNSPGGVVIETLLNIRTVASLTMEKARSKEYVEALHREHPHPLRANLLKGTAAGFGQFCQQWGMALMFWWGGWLLYKYPGEFSYRDFLISMFALLFSLSGMGVAAQGATDREKAKAAARRIFTLMERESKIDPLSDDGKKDD